MFGNWSTCSVTCGHGEQMRTRNIEIAATNGGRNCDGSETETRPCNITCPGMTKHFITFDEIEGNIRFYGVVEILIKRRAWKH